MRDQITTGITEANNNHGLGLTPATINTLTESILAALAATPTEGPTLVTAPTRPVLSLSATAVVAMVASAALHARNHTGPDNTNVTVLDTNYWVAEDDRREFRQFLFVIQHMFGVRVRATRLYPDGCPSFLAVGERNQLDAMHRVSRMLHAAAAPQVAEMSADERRIFWATLGHLVSATESAQTLIADNTVNYANATTYLNTEFGPARNLTRTAPAESGTVFESAEALITESLPSF